MTTFIISAIIGAAAWEIGKRVYYAKTGKNLLGIKPLKTPQDDHK